MYDILTIGEILVEVLSEHVGQTFSEPGILLGPYPSGAPAIFIDQAARMGASSAIIAKIGRDDFGRLNLNRLRSDGVDVSHIIETSGNSTGVAFVTYFEDGSRQFIFHFTKAACGELCVDDVSDEVIRSCRYLHIMGCSITGSPTMGEAIMRAVRISKECGTKISFDPNIRPELLNGKILDYYREIIDACDILLTGKSELNLLFGGYEKAIEDLLRQKDRIVVVKDGSRGTSVFTREKAFTVATFPALEADPTGAGDCFDGTFLASVAAGARLEDAVVKANAAGAKAVEKRGPMEGNTTQEELEAFMGSCSIPKPVAIANPFSV